MKIKNIVRNTLLTTTSLVALSFATNAFSADVAVAQEVDDPVSVNVGGYFSSAIILNSNNQLDNENSMSVATDGEIQFTAEATLESGITVGARVELEAFTASDQIDEHYIYANTAFGSFKLGADDAVGSSLIPGTSDYGIATGVDDPTLSAALDQWTGTSTTLTGDSNKLTYISPSLGGGKIGFSFTPHDATTGGNGGGSNLASKSDTTLRGVVGVAASYGGSFSGFGVKLGAGWEAGKNDHTTGRQEKSVIAVGGGVSYAGASLNARFSIVTDKTGAFATLGSDAQKTTGIAVSGSYAIDDFTIGVGYASRKNKDDATNLYYGFDAIRVGGGVKYDLGSGVTAGVSFASESLKATAVDLKTKATLIALELGANF